MPGCRLTPVDRTAGTGIGGSPSRTSRWVASGPSLAARLNVGYGSPHRIRQRNTNQRGTNTEMWPRNMSTALGGGRHTGPGGAFRQVQEEGRRQGPEVVCRLDLEAVSAPGRVAAFQPGLGAAFQRARAEDYQRVPEADFRPGLGGGLSTGPGGGLSTMGGPDTYRSNHPPYEYLVPYLEQNGMKWVADRLRVKLK